VTGTGIEQQLMQLEELSIRQLESVRGRDLDRLETLESERRRMLADLDQDALADLARRQPDLVGERLRTITENDRLAQLGLRVALEELGRELGETGTRHRAERAYLKMASRS
jgi:hypothetical protein